MTSFISDTILKKETGKFMSKYYIKNFLRQFTKTLGLCFRQDTTHLNLVMCH